MPCGDNKAIAEYCGKVILAKMREAREYADKLETITAEEYWPFPTYSDLLLGVR